VYEEGDIKKEGVVKVIGNCKCRKASDIDRIKTEMLKYGEAIIDWMYIICHLT